MAISRDVGAAVRGTIAAPLDALWAIVADPRRHPELAGSNEPQEITMATEGPPRVGSRFEARQKAFGLRYVSKSLVTAYDPPRVFRWKLSELSEVIWEFRLEQMEAGTRVHHSYRWHIPGPAAVALLFRPLQQRRNQHNARAMVETLRNLARLASAPPPENIELSFELPSLDD